MLREALRRYETVFLPLLASWGDAAAPLVPPLDCAWLWHCHKLDPVAYARDCQARAAGWEGSRVNVGASATPAQCPRLTPRARAHAAHRRPGALWQAAGRAGGQPRLRVCALGRAR